MESYEKIFLRLTATGLQALGRNMLYASTQKVFQGDDDEEEETRRREQKNEAVNIIENWMDNEELEDTGRSQFVPQILGEPLFYTPASYWLQVITFTSCLGTPCECYTPQVVGRSLTGAGFLGVTVVGLKTLELRCSVSNWSVILVGYIMLYYIFFQFISQRHRLQQ